MAVGGTPDPERHDNDDSFKSSAENDAVPEINTGSISNSTDYQQIYVASEAINDQLYAYVSFIRWDTNGTGTFSFELNQSGLLTSNGVTYQRTQDDVLLEFNFQKSADNWVVTLTYRLWNGNATSGSWSNAIAMGGFAEGSVNAGTIQNCLNGNASLVSGAFGEFAVNLSGLLGDDCAAFGTILAKSRASNTVTSALDDLAGPIPVDFNTCGELTILKQDENQQALGGASFSISPNPFGDDTPDPLIVTDGVAPDDDATGGTIHLTGVEPGTYKVCETAAPPGYIIDTACDIEIIGPLGSATFGPFTNGLGDISWTKVNSQTDQPLCCATFSLVGTADAALGTNLTVVDNGTNDSDPAGGALLVKGLKLGTYVITETTPPAGYDADPDSQTVVLSGETASAEFAFEDAPQADASIDKAADVTPIVAGEDASFTINVHAGGTGASEAVVLTDVNETGHDWTVSGTDSVACGLDLVIEDGDTLTCNFGTVPNNDDREITITMASDAGDCELGIANTASVASSNDHDLTNNEDSDSVTVLCPNPGVAKDASVDTIVFGEDAVFTIVVSAGGTGPTENVVLSDLNDTGHTWTVTGTDAGGCDSTTVLDGETLTCTWASIANDGNDQSRTITITLTSGEADCDLDISNTASITADADVDESNNEDSASVHVLCPDASVLKTADVDPITAGDPASFTILVSANDTAPSDNVVLTDTNNTGHDWLVTGDDAGDCPDVNIADGEVLTCTFGTISAGDDRTITITMTSDADDCAQGIANTATITSDADVDASNDTSSDSITVLCPDLEIEKSTDTPEVSADDEVHYTVTVSNETGDAEARNVTITDDLPDGLTWTEDSEDCLINVDGNLVCEDLTIPAGESFSVTLTGTTDSGDCPSIENTAEFTSSNGGDGSSDSDQRGATVITVNCPDVTVDKEPVDPTISAGEWAQFTIKVTNDGPGEAHGVVVTDYAPEGTVWEVLDDGGASCESFVGGDNQSIICTIGDLADDAWVTITIQYLTTEADCGMLDNLASVVALNEPDENAENNSDEASIVVQCPGLNFVKTADVDPIDAGDEASFTLTVWNAGPGDAFDVELHDDLPAGLAWDFVIVSGDATDEDCMVASSIVLGGEQQMSIDCEFGTLGVTSMEDGIVIRVFADTDRTDCGLLENDAWVDASNDDRIDAGADILVKCPTIGLEKTNDAVGSVLPGTTVTYTLTLTVDDGPANDVVVVDVMPVGLGSPTDISNGGIEDPAGTITWNLGDLDDGEYTLTYKAVVADDVENGEELTNAAAATSTNSQCPPELEVLGPECEDDSTVIVRVPTLVIDKVADTNVITITGPNNAPVATPSVVTWTLTYTLTNGPVTNAVITDEVPVGFEFLDASDGGTEAGGVVTWNLASPLTESGSVTFRTTVDPETISRVAPTVNTAVIVSDQTPEDEGQDSVTVTREEEQGGNPTPTPRPIPNTATGTGLNGEPITVPIELLVAFFIGSLGALALANVKARNNRR